MADNRSQMDTSTTASGTKMGAESNPFTADLKGEFHSHFGATTPVSNVLASGDGGKKRKLILFSIAAVVLGLMAYSLLSESEEGEVSEEELAQEEDAETKETDDVVSETPEQPADTTDAKNATTPEAKEVKSVAAKQEASDVSKDMAKPVEATMTATEAPVVEIPANGQSRAYDETSEDAVFKWSGSPGGEVYFSRNSNFSPVARKARVDGNTYEFRDPWPGKWYMKVVNGAGSSSVVSFDVKNPEKRNISISSPADGQTIAGSGGVVTWNGDAKVARYKVELSNGNWAQPVIRLQTVGTEAGLNGVAAGSYKLRVAAWSEVSGRWEYSTPISVSIQ